MTPKFRSKGFTMVELLIVAVLAMVLLALSAPFVSALSAELAMLRTLRQVRTDLVTGLSYAMAGKSIAALSQNDLTNPELIPGYYGLHFQRDEDYGDPHPYSYVEFSAQVQEQNSQEAKPLYALAKDLPSTAVFLQEIRLRQDAEDEGKALEQILVLFAPPFGKVAFSPSVTPESAFDPMEVFRQSGEGQVLELIFQHKDDEISRTTLRFGADKILQIE